MKVSDMFPRRWLSGEDLQGKAWRLRIKDVGKEEMRPNPGAPPVEKFVVYFDGAQKGVILNRTLAYEIAQVLGTEDTGEWTGKEITIYPQPMTVAGKHRVGIRARAADVKA